MEERMSMPSCPMAATCKGMMDKPGSGFWMIIPGIVFILLGVATIIYPQILAWLVAIALIVMGLFMIMMVNFMRSFGRRMRHGPT